MATRPYSVRAAKHGKKWRVVVASGNGTVISTSNTSYETKGSAERAADTFAKTPLVFDKLPRENAR